MLDPDPHKMKSLSNPDTVVLEVLKEIMSEKLYDLNVFCLCMVQVTLKLIWRIFRSSGFYEFMKISVADPDPVDPY